MHEYCLIIITMLAHLRILEADILIIILGEYMHKSIKQIVQQYPANIIAHGIFVRIVRILALPSSSSSSPSSSSYIFLPLTCYKYIFPNQL